MNPNSLKNLIPNNQRTREELREMGRKGGKASARVRRENRKLETTITIATTDGAVFRIKAKTPESAAITAASLESAIRWQFVKMELIKQGVTYTLSELFGNLTGTEIVKVSRPSPIERLQTMTKRTYTRVIDPRNYRRD